MHASLGDVATWGSGGTPSRKITEYYQGTIPWIKTGELGSKFIRFAEEKITEKAIRESSAKIFPKESVGIAMYGATIGKVSVWGIDASTNQACAVAQTHSYALNNIFLYYFLLSEKQNIIKAGKGGAQPNISQGILKEWPIFLPPLNEQHRIVTKIEELFSELDKGIESLKKAREQLKIYRQAVLKHAFEGKLTEKWREENADKLETADQLLARIQKEREARYQQQLDEWKEAVKKWEVNAKEGKKPAKPRINKQKEPVSTDESDKICNIPKNWSWVRPENIVSPTPYSIGIGPFGSNLKVSDYRDEGVPLIFVRNITRNDFSLNLKYIDQKKSEELKAHVVEPLDIVITKMGDPPGDCQIYPPESQKAILTADCLKFRIWSDFVERDFYKYCIWSSHVKKQLGLITKGVAQKKISVDRFKTIAIPLPPQEEQKQIIKEIESKFSIIIQLEADLEINLKKSEVLRQSILKKAFSGQLVEQDPNDEPASILLERIKAEKEKQIKFAHKKKRTKKRKTAA
ncbi:MAG TPA: restriction endonuclease [Gammaproteobacteria bacterium]|nr:restriction endonuclease [Gammaproteobacteria bacterium]